MKQVLRFFSYWLAVLSLGSLTACSGGSGGAIDLPPLVLPPVITAQPAAVSVYAGQPAVFSVTATGSGSVTYQWRRNGDNLAGATASSYTVNPTGLGDNGAQFSVVVSNLGISTTSSSAVLNVAAATLPTISATPGLVVTPGTVVNMTANAVGTGPFTYQWFRGGSALAGATSASYSLTTSLADNGSTFSVAATSPFGTLSSASATLSVPPVRIVSGPGDVTVRRGERARFTVIAEGSGPFNIRWLRNGQPFPGGDLNNVQVPSFVLDISDAQDSDSGAQFSIVVTNSLGSVTSSVATLTVVP